MNIEDAYVIAGNFGRFQILLTVVNYYANILFGSQLLIMVIVGATPNKAVPVEANLTTIVTEWDLYDEQWVVSLMSSLFLAGYIAGSLAFGQLPDLYGRKPVLVIGTLLATVCCFCSAFCQSWHTFALTRFFGGFFAGGAVAPAFVLMCELIGKNLWASIGMLYQIFFSLGVMLLGLLGYLLRDWRKIIMVSSGLAALVVPLFMFLVPESPRWLYSVGNIAQAEKNIRFIARKNGKDDSVIKLSRQVDVGVNKEDFKKHSLIDLFRIKTLAFYLVAATYVWFATAVSYYGLTLNVSDLMPNLYLAIVLSGAVEIPGYIITLLMMDHKWPGRNGTLVLLLLASSLSSICILFTNDDSGTAVKTSLGLISKLTVAAAFSVMFIYVSEIFPTQLRTVAMVFANTFVRSGAIIATFVPLLGSTAFFLPYVIFGVVTLIAGLVSLTLPETFGRRMIAMGDFETITSCDETDVERINEDENAPLLS